jgi:hypothetical protein
MTLGFSKKINNKPTFFVEKIWASLGFDIKTGLVRDLIFDSPIWFNPEPMKPKKHTIRKDEKDRWKVGNDIHFVINNRTKNRFQFAPIIKVQSIQKIEMVIRGVKNERPINVYIDDEIIGLGNGLEQLALNDGFDSLEDFYDYFKDGFKGKLIHWTDARY